MKLSCNVIRDILPLYVEDLASEDTRKIVEEHINNCNNCKKELEEIKSSNVTPIDTDTKLLEKIRTTIRRKKIQSVVFSITITLVIAIILVAFLTAPDYLNDVTSVSIVENSDGTVLVYFDEEVSGYDIERYYANNGYVYDITTWDSIWGRNFSRRKLNSIVLNADGEDVESVYYYHTDDSLNTLIHGRDQHPSGGSKTLPRLALAYYLLIAVGVIAICVMVLIMFRKDKRVMNVITKIIFLPISYIIAHILIKGFNTTSYSMLRDFLAIILVMIGLYIATLSGINIIKEKKRKRLL